MSDTGAERTLSVKERLALLNSKAVIKTTSTPDNQKVK